MTSHSSKYYIETLFQSHPQCLVKIWLQLISTTSSPISLSLLLTKLKEHSLVYSLLVDWAKPFSLCYSSPFIVPLTAVFVLIVYMIHSFLSSHHYHLSEVLLFYLGILFVSFSAWNYFLSLLLSLSLFVCGVCWFLCAALSLIRLQISWM